MMTDAPSALPAAGLYMVSVGMTTLRAMRPLRFSMTSCHVQASEPGATPGQMAKTPAASDVRGAGVWAKRVAEKARRMMVRIGTHLTPSGRKVRFGNVWRRPRRHD